jgi:pimeloyl-ACP methyl ester carboxylesterase
VYVRLVALLALVGVACLGGPAASSAPESSADVEARERCRTVVRKVGGKRKRVRICPRPRPRPPAPSPVRRIDVGGYRLAIECRGTGEPTLVLDSGGSTSRNAWLFVHAAAARTTRVCTYDRAGLGESDPRPGEAATTAKIVDELHTLLERAGIPPPYVLGGWSIGGFNVLYYTRRYPSEVAGLVLVDGTPPAVALARLPEPLVRLETMFLDEAATDLVANGALGSRPLIVLTRGRGSADAALEAEFLEAQRQVAARSTSSLLVRAERAGHAIQDEQGALVVEAFRLVVVAVRAHAALPACATTALPALGGTCLPV